MQPNQKPIKQTIKALMTGMNHHDPDVAQMAAKDLCKHILQGAIDLKLPENRDLAKTITQDYLKQVGSMSFAVHSAAIRCLAEIVPKISNQQLIHVFKSTIGSITDPKTQSKRMQVFSSSASTMINLAPGDLGIKLSTLFVQCVNQFLKLSTITTRKNSKQEEQVLIHLLHLIIDFSQKWPDVVGNKQIKYDKRLLIQVLLKNVQSSHKLDLISKSDVAIQKLASGFERSQFQFAFDHKQVGILPFIFNHKNSSDQENLKRLKNGITCLGHIANAHNRQMKPWVKNIAKICVQLINSYKNNAQNLYLTTQIIQSSIDCLTSLLKAYSTDLTQWIGTANFSFLSSFLDQTLNFDLQNSMTYLDNSSEMQDEMEEQQDYYSQGSVCWKVRQVSLSYVTMLMKKDMQFKQKKGKSIQFLNLLSTKLIEQNENVNKKAFECFNYIIQSISTTKKHSQAEQQMVLKRVRSNEGSFAFTLVDKISSKIGILFNHKKTKQETKTEAAKTLLNLIQLLNQLIKDNDSVCFKILTLIQELLPKVKPESCVFLIKSSKTLINGSLPYEKVLKMIDVYIKMTKNNNFKVVAASFDGLRNVLKRYHQQLLKSGKINEILNIWLPKLKEHDADKLVKVQAIRCFGPIYSSIFTKLSENIQNQILASTQTKLKVQIDKTTIFSQIPCIPNQYVIKKSQQAVFKNILHMCSQSIGNSNFELSNLAIQCCNKLIRLQGNDMNDKAAQLILSKSRPLLMDGKIPKFLDVLLDRYPNQFKNYAESIVKTAESPYIVKLIQKKIITVQNCIGILKSIATAQNFRKLSVILSQIYPVKQKLLAQCNQTKWGLVCLGALGYIGDLSTINQIQAIIHNQQNHDLKFEGARAIGNIASRYPDYVFQLLQFSKKSNEGYLYLQALKEMLSFRTTQFPKIQAVIHFIFAKCQESDRQINKHLLAECIGHVARISHSELKKILQSADQMNPARRFIVASSLRYALQDSKNKKVLDESFQDYIQKVFRMTQDKDVNVREGAFKSLNSILDSVEDFVRSLIDKNFLTYLLDSMSIKAQYIKIIDYGVSKQKKDLGKGLRIQAFNFLKSIINMRQVENYYDQIVSKCLEKINQQSSNDLVLKRISIIRIISEKDYTVFLPYQNDFAVKIGTTQGILKSFSAANMADDQRSEGYLKGLFKQISTITKLNKEGGSQSIRAMMNKIKTFQRLNKILESVENND